MAGLTKQGFISCQGESGSCAFGASRVHYFNYVPAPQPSFEDVLRRVAERDAERGIVPIQNSKSGLITEPLALIAKSDLHIVAEHHQRIRHHLMVPRDWVKSVIGEEKIIDALATDILPETQREQLVRALLAQVTAVYSDEQGLRQCDRSLKIKLAGAERILTSCTAKASRLISHEVDHAKVKEEEIPAHAAIASEDCAGMYKNLLLVRDLNDDPNNTSRYVAVSRTPPEPADIVRDIDVKDILSAFTNQNDLDLLFRRAPLRERLAETHTRFSLDGDAEEAGQIRSAEAHLLREFLASDDWSKTRLILNGLLGNDGERIGRKLAPLARQIRGHAQKADSRHGKLALARMLKSRHYAPKLRSVFTIRARDAKVSQGDLLRPFVQSGTRHNTPIRFRVLAELPHFAGRDGKDDEDMVLLVEADGCLLDAQKRFDRHKEHGGLFGGGFAGGEISDLERVLHQIARVADIRVLGTFAKEPLRLGKQVTVKPLKTGTLTLGSPADDGGRGAVIDDVAESRSLSPALAGMFAALLATGVAVAGLVYYLSQNGGF